MPEGCYGDVNSVRPPSTRLFGWSWLLGTQSGDVKLVYVCCSCVSEYKFESYRHCVSALLCACLVEYAHIFTVYEHKSNNYRILPLTRRQAVIQHIYIYGYVRTVCRWYNAYTRRTSPQSGSYNQQKRWSARNRTGSSGGNMTGCEILFVRCVARWFMSGVSR